MNKLDILRELANRNVITAHEDPDSEETARSHNLLFAVGYIRYASDQLNNTKITPEGLEWLKQNDSGGNKTMRFSKFVKFTDVLDTVLDYLLDIEFSSVSEAKMVFDIVDCLGYDPNHYKGWVTNTFNAGGEEELLESFCRWIYKGDPIVYLDHGEQHFHIGGIIQHIYREERHIVMGFDEKENLLQIATENGLTWVNADYYYVKTIPHWVRTDVDDGPLSKALVPPFAILNEEGDTLQGGFRSLQSALDAAKNAGVSSSCSIENGYGCSIEGADEDETD